MFGRSPFSEDTIKKQETTSNVYKQKKENMTKTEGENINKAEESESHGASPHTATSLVT